MSVSSEHARERKRKSRQRRIDLLVRIEALSRSCGIQPVVGGVGKTAHAETKMLELAVRAVKACKQNQKNVVVQQDVVPESPEKCKLAKETLMTSSTLGTMLIRTGDLTVLVSNRALANWWMFNNAELSVGSGVEGRGLVGQSLWSIVHWENFDEVEAMHTRLKSGDRSIIGKHFDLGLIRMTNSGPPALGCLAKVVRRRVEVLHMSRDGEIALLGIIVEEEDKALLDVGEEGREWLREAPQVFQCSDFGPWTKPSENGENPVHNDGGVRSVLSITNLPRIMASMSQYSPKLYFVVGQDRDGMLRMMGFTRISPMGVIASGVEESVHAPICNIRIGSLKSSHEVSFGSDGLPQVTRACAAWLIEGDDKNSRDFPWRFKEAAGKKGRERAEAATNGYALLVSYFTSQSGSSGPGVCVGYVSPNQRGVICSTRRSAGVDEMRPRVMRFGSHVLRGVCSIGADQDPEAARVRQTFELFEGKQEFWDYGEFF